MSFSLPKLEYSYDALEPHIDARTMEIHHSKHHQGYTNKLNAALEGTVNESKTILDILNNLDMTNMALRNNAGGYYNHKLFWEVIDPNKENSLSENLKTAISDAKSGQAEIRNDKDGNIGVSIGKKSFSDDQLLKNYNAILDALEKEKSNNTLKGDLIRSVFATSTMGVSYKVKLGKSI